MIGQKPGSPLTLNHGQGSGPAESLEAYAGGCDKLRVPPVPARHSGVAAEACLAQSGTRTLPDIRQSGLQRGGGGELGISRRMNAADITVTEDELRR